jgi:hypothetical protein
MKATCAAQHPAKKKEHEERQDLNALVAEAVVSAIKTQCKMKKRKKANDDDQLAEENTTMSPSSRRDEVSTLSSSSSLSNSSDK